MKEKVHGGGWNKMRMIHEPKTVHDTRMAKFLVLFFGGESSYNNHCLAYKVLHEFSRVGVCMLLLEAL